MMLTTIRISRKVGLCLTALSASLLLVLFGVQPALADDAPEISNAVDTISSVAPGLLAQTSPDAPVDVSQPTDNQSPEISVANVDAGLATGTSFSVDYATSTDMTVDGLTVLGTETPDVMAYVQPTAMGVRVITAIASSDAPSDYSYSFDVPSDTQLVEGSSGFYLESGTDVLGTILPAWATDSSGNPVTTSYSWDSGVLTQHVDLTSPSIDFPVLADPAWGYSYSYTLNKSPAASKALLKSCFNCYFPVTGAPRGFPVAGQVLPLWVGLANFECKFRAEFNSTNYFGYQFDATKNHIDGLGSNIIFEFAVAGGVKKLIVSAYIVNNSWWNNNAAYRLGALSNWANFANKLNAA